MERNLKKSFIYSILLFAVVIMGLTLFANYYTPKQSNAPSSELTLEQKAAIEKRMNEGAVPVTSISDEDKKKIEKAMAEDDMIPVSELTDAEKEKIEVNFK